MCKFVSNVCKVLPIVGVLAHPPGAEAQITRVVNAASLISNAALAPGSIITIFGTNLATGVAVPQSTDNPPLSLGSVTASVGGAQMALFYVSPTQINAVLSAATLLGAQTLTVTSTTGTFPASVTIDTNAPPGLFSLIGTGTHDGAILNAATFALGPFSVVTTKGLTSLAIFATGLNLSIPPGVTVGGVEAAVQFFGKAPCCIGLEQINVTLPPSLAGAGRVEVVVQSGGQVSNAVEVVLLPNQGQGPFQSDQENQAHSRELAGIAYVPGTSLALVTDENDDVVRVVDIAQRKVSHTIALADGAEPVAAAVNASGTLAVIAERGRGKAAILDLAASTVVAEVATDLGPVSVGIAGTQAVVVNGDADSVTMVDFVAHTALKTISVGRGPRGVAVDTTNLKAYITNEDDGTVSVIDIAGLSVANTITLGASLRPAAIQLVPGSNFAIVTVPSGGNNGEVLILNITTGTFTTVGANPDRSGGSSDVAVNGPTAFFANQAGASVSFFAISTTTGVPAAPPANIKVDLGARALAIDTKDNALLVTNEGSGTVVVVDLASGKVIAHIDGVRGEMEDSNNDDHTDHDHASNVPTISSLNPATAKATSTFTLTISGTNLKGTSRILFVNPVAIHGKGGGKGELPESDSAFVASNIQVNSSGTQVTATINLTGAAQGPRLVIVETPNEDSSFALTAADTFTVIP
jgi:uncharacterized protein (TIGR03437 family)